MSDLAPGLVNTFFYGFIMISSHQNLTINILFFALAGTF